MNSEIIIALISLAGSAIGALSGILISNKLIIYRIEQLEKKVDKHNNLVERTYAVEERVSVSETKIKQCVESLEDLKDELKRFLKN